MSKLTYRIFNKETKRYEGVYSRAYHDKYDFDSEQGARNANCHGVYKDKDVYDIHVFKISEERVD